MARIHSTQHQAQRPRIPHWHPVPAALLCPGTAGLLLAKLSMKACHRALKLPPMPPTPTTLPETHVDSRSWPPTSTSGPGVNASVSDARRC